MLKFAVSLLFFAASLHAQDSSVTKAKSECESLLGNALPFAEQMLSEHGEFYPYGQALSSDGKVVAVAASDGSEHPPSRTIIDLLKRGFESGARDGTYKATALVYDVKVTLPTTGEKSDAIAVELDHIDEYSVVVFVPYSLEGGKPIYGEMFAQKGAGQVFGAE
jgi:hypothetical protein